jgi:hypothetical protein
MAGQFPGLLEPRGVQEGGKDMTISEMLSLVSQVKGRLAGLQSLRSECAKKTSYFGEDGRIIEPTYSVILVDKKISELQRWIFKAEAAIKLTNAKTEVLGLETDVDSLLESLQ